MKKTVLIFVVLLAGLFFSLSLLGRRSEYSAEKSIWAINQDFIKISKDPKTTPDVAFDQILQKYDDFIQKFPDSGLVSMAYISSGKVYIFKKKYKIAREELEEAITKSSNSIIVGVKAMESILQSYVLEKDDNNLLKTYERVLQEYPTTSLGLKTPLLISQFYSQRNEPKKADKTLDDAITHYKILAKKYPDTIIEYHVLEAMSSCYLGQKKWNEAVNILGDILIKFSNARFFTPKKAEALTKSINTISIFKLKNTRLPVKIYQKFMSEHPRHPLNKTLKGIIQKLNAVKEEKKETFL